MISAKFEVWGCRSLGGNAAVAAGREGFHQDIQTSARSESWELAQPVRTAQQGGSRLSAKKTSDPGSLQGAAMSVIECEIGFRRFAIDSAAGSHQAPRTMWVARRAQGFYVRFVC